MPIDVTVAKTLSKGGQEKYLRRAEGGQGYLFEVLQFKEALKEKDGSIKALPKDDKIGNALFTQEARKEWQRMRTVARAKVAEALDARKAAMEAAAAAAASEGSLRTVAEWNDETAAAAKERLFYLLGLKVLSKCAADIARAAEVCVSVCLSMCGRAHVAIAVLAGRRSAAWGYHDQSFACCGFVCLFVCLFAAPGGERKESRQGGQRGG